MKQLGWNGLKENTGILEKSMASISLRPLRQDLSSNPAIQLRI